MINRLHRVVSFYQQLLQGRYYWILLFILSLTLELTALYYQYALDYYPCVLCIHVRVWLAGLMFVSFLATAFYQQMLVQRLAHLFNLIIWIGMAERSWQLLGVERGFIFGECNMDAGLPSWLALDQWFPSVFKVWEACGYTPELIFRITMAETLLVMSGLMLMTAMFSLYWSVMRVRQR